MIEFLVTSLFARVTISFACLILLALAWLWLFDWQAAVTFSSLQRCSIIEHSKSPPSAAIVVINTLDWSLSAAPFSSGLFSRLSGAFVALLLLASSNHDDQDFTALCATAQLRGSENTKTGHENEYSSVYTKHVITYANPLYYRPLFLSPPPPPTPHFFSPNNNNNNKTYVIE